MNTAAHPAHQPVSWLSSALWGLNDTALLARLRRGPRPAIPLVVDDEWREPERVEALMGDVFDLAGEAHRLPLPIDWLTNPSRDVEWHILLHKAYYLPGLVAAWQATGLERYVQRWAALVGDWLDRDVPPGFIAVDVTGRRVQNWVYSLHALLADPVLLAPLDARLVRRMLASLSTQVDHLCEHLTPKRNHRTIELLAIYLAGAAFPELAMAARWRAFALREAALNIEADLLPDGVHCELSTDYHHLALRNWMAIRQLAAACGDRVPPAMDLGLRQALAFALHVHKPDGRVPSLSDGDVRSFLPLLAQGAVLFNRPDWAWVASRGARGRRPTQTLAVFPDSGYVVWRSGWGGGRGDIDRPAYLVFDCGPLGEGNHGHFDCLSIELAAHGRSLVVDPGRYTYSEAPDPQGINWRVHFRGTAAHNTVCVDGRDQTRYEPRPVKGPTRHGAGAVRHKVSGPAPEATLLGAWQADDFALLHGRAVGQDYPVTHERAIVCLGADGWLVTDRLLADQPHRYAAGFQLHPAAYGASKLVPAAEGGCWRMDSPGLTILQPDQPGLAVALSPGWVSERYGHKLPAPRLVSRWRAADALLHTLLVPWAGAAPLVALQPLDLRDPADPGSPWGGPPAGTGLHVSAWCASIGSGAAGRRHTWLMVHGADGASAAATPWCWSSGDGGAEPVRTWQFTGAWLHLCETADGQLLAARAPEGSQLRLDGRGMPCQTARPAPPRRGSEP